jgi:hypothetical protein
MGWRASLSRLVRLCVEVELGQGSGNILADHRLYVLRQDNPHVLDEAGEVLRETGRCWPPITSSSVCTSLRRSAAADISCPRPGPAPRA